MLVPLASLALAAPPVPEGDDCNPIVPGWHVEVASALGASAAQAREAARAAAVTKLHEKWCPPDTSWSPARCAELRAAIHPFPGRLVSERGRRAEACATAGIYGPDVDAWRHEAQGLDAALRGLVDRVGASAGASLVVAPARWSTGGPAGDLGRVVTARLLSLATGWRSELAAPGTPGDRRLALELTAQPDGVVVVVPRLDTVGSERTTSVAGLSFRADLLGFRTADLRDGVPDTVVGVDGGARVGPLGLVARLDVTAPDGRLCPGTEFRPRMTVNLDADVRLLNLAPNGRTQWVWGGTIRAGQSADVLLEAVHAPGGPERLVMLASPVGRGLGPTTSWTAWCQTEARADLFPRDAAVATSTFSIPSPGWAGCPQVVGGTYPEPPPCPR